jgi:hypothetical protein
VLGRRWWRRGGGSGRRKRRRGGKVCGVGHCGLLSGVLRVLGRLGSLCVRTLELRLGAFFLNWVFVSVFFLGLEEKGERGGERDVHEFSDVEVKHSSPRMGMS